MVFKKSFILLVATGTTPFFTVVLIISEGGCSFSYILQLTYILQSEAAKGGILDNSCSYLSADKYLRNLK